jgi:hypothetical protein
MEGVMKRSVVLWRSWTPAVITGLMLFMAVPLFAQEQEKKGEGCCEQGSGAMSHDHRAQRQKMHEQMEAMHNEIGKKFHDQLTALREHAKKMDDVTDEKALLVELKKHQQMTDDFLGSMVEFHEKMHAHMKEHHEHMHHHMQKGAGESKKEEGGAESQTK